MTKLALSQYKVKIGLFVLYYYIKMSMTALRIATFMLGIVLRVFPDKFFKFAMFTPLDIANVADGKRIESVDIMNAQNEKGDITNKLRFYLKYFWEESNELFETSGFDVSKLFRALNSSFLIVSYVISDYKKREKNESPATNKEEKGEVSVKYVPVQPLPRRISVFKKDNQYYKKSEEDTEELLLFDHLELK
jgi:hypothetical protein